MERRNEPTAPISILQRSANRDRHGAHHRVERGVIVDLDRHHDRRRIGVEQRDAVDLALRAGRRSSQNVYRGRAIGVDGGHARCGRRGVKVHVIDVYWAVGRGDGPGQEDLQLLGRGCEDHRRKLATRRMVARVSPLAAGADDTQSVPSDVSTLPEAPAEVSPVPP